MREPRETRAARTRAFVIHPDLDRRRDPTPRFGEAMALARALPDLDVVGGEVVPLRDPRPGTLFGTGRLAEIGARLKAEDVELVLVDGPVTPVQQRNLEKEWGVKLLDRTGLILEIFSDRAATREGVLQVEMAALAYQRTRLVRAWTHLERQRGGLGFVGGPGETQIEADRRAIDEQITRLKRQLEKVVRTRQLHRDARAKVPYPVVALVGYTNAGKSTLFNRLTGADVLVKDMLFATLDPTMRAVRLDGAGDVILSDTVGFVSELPTQLVAAFRATLEEVLSADLILHVRDIAAAESVAQAADVEEILASLGTPKETPRIEVWNKIDLLSAEQREAMLAQASRRPDVVPISAVGGEGIDELMDRIGEALGGIRLEDTVILGPERGRQRAWLHQSGLVEDETLRDDGASEVRVRWTQSQKGAFERL